MTSPPAQSFSDALELTVSLAEAVESGASWTETALFARRLLAQHGEDLVLSQAWLTIRALTALRDLANALPPQQPLIGVDRPATVLSLLAQFRADAEREADGR